MMSSVCLMAETRSSMKSARRDDDYPYLVPLFKLNGLDIYPLVITDAVGVLCCIGLAVYVRTKSKML